MSKPTISQHTETPSRAEQRLLPQDFFGRSYYGGYPEGEEARCTQWWEPSTKWARWQPGSIPSEGYYWVRYYGKDSHLRTVLCRPEIGNWEVLDGSHLIEYDRTVGFVYISPPPLHTEISTYEPLKKQDDDYLEMLAKEASAEDAADMERESKLNE